MKRIAKTATPFALVVLGLCLAAAAHSLEAEPLDDYLVLAEYEAPQPAEPAVEEPPVPAAASVPEPVLAQTEPVKSAGDTAEDAERENAPEDSDKESGESNETGKEMEEKRGEREEIEEDVLIFRPRRERGGEGRPERLQLRIQRHEDCEACREYREHLREEHGDIGRPFGPPPMAPGRGPGPGPRPRMERLFGEIAGDHPELAEEIRKGMAEGDSLREAVRDIVEELGESEDIEERELVDRLRVYIREGRGPRGEGPRGPRFMDDGAWERGPRRGEMGRRGEGPRGPRFMDDGAWERGPRRGEMGRRGEGPRGPRFMDDDAWERGPRRGEMGRRGEGPRDPRFMDDGEWERGPRRGGWGWRGEAPHVQWLWGMGPNPDFSFHGAPPWMEFGPGGRNQGKVMDQIEELIERFDELEEHLEDLEDQLDDIEDDIDD